MASFVRITALIWADLFATFAMYVMMTYLTNVWNLSTTYAAGIINVWNGMVPVLAIVLAVIVDTFMGDFYMLVLSSIAYSIGLGLLSMSTPPVFGPCKGYKEECVGHTQKVLFFTALPLIAVGMAGHVVSLEPFLALQIEKKKAKENGTENDKEKEMKNGKEKEKEKDNEDERQKEKEVGVETEEGFKGLLQIPGLIMVVVVSIVGGIALPYIKPWSLRFGIPAICSVVATFMFLTGFRRYKHVKPEESPLKNILRLFVASAGKISQPMPNPTELYNDNDTRSTSTLRCLDKAAVKLPEQQQLKIWNLCSVSEVEDTKTGIRMLPMWLTFIVIGIVLSVGNTYFLGQANHMDRKLGSIKVSIPIFLIFYKVSSYISASFYPNLRDLLPKKKYAPAFGIATSMFISVLCCITAAKVETRRLRRIRDHGLLDKLDYKIPMSIFALLPQFMLLAAVDGFANISITNFFQQQTPESMRKYLNYFTKGVIGLGTMASVLSVYIVGKVSERHQKPNWFQFSLNRSHLDRYYWVLAALSAANLIVYVIVACFYKYKEPMAQGDDENEGGEMREDFQDNAKCCC